jgi:predicted transcriptional regulator
MDAATLLREARRAAGLSQRRLATAAGVPQPSVARIESGAVEPRFETLDRLLAACGRGVATVVRPGTGVDRSQIRAMLALTPAERLRVAVTEAANVERLAGGPT